MCHCYYTATMSLYQFAATFLSLVVPLAVGYLLSDTEVLRSARSRKRMKEFEKQQEDLELREQLITKKEKSLVAQEHMFVEQESAMAAREMKVVELEKREVSLSEKVSEWLEEEKEREKTLLCREKSVLEKEKVLDDRESSLAEKEAALKTREIDLAEKESGLLELEKRLKEKESMGPAVVEEVSTGEDEVAEPVVEEQSNVNAEKEKRIVMIKDELQNLIKQAEQEELEDEMEEEAVTALEKAALIVAYRKKYYDVLKDRLIYFPTVAQSVVSYTLMEEAEKYYYDEDDEFPTVYSGALRSVVTMNMGDDDDDDMDEEYMTKLALDVEI